MGDLVGRFVVLEFYSVSRLFRVLGGSLWDSCVQAFKLADRPLAREKLHSERRRRYSQVVEGRGDPRSTQRSVAVNYGDGESAGPFATGAICSLLVSGRGVVVEVVEVVEIVDVADAAVVEAVDVV